MREPVIQKAILSVLLKSDKPLSFSEIKRRVAYKLNRDVSSIDNKSISRALRRLMEDGLVDRILSDSKRPSYILTKAYRFQMTKNWLLKIIGKLQSRSVFEEIQDAVGYTVPYIIFVEPPLSKFGEGFILDWSDFESSVSQMMVNDFIYRLSRENRTKVMNLILWAYWAGVRGSIDGEGSFLISERFLLGRSIDYTTRIIKDLSRQKTRSPEIDARLKIEKILLRMQKLAYDLFKKENLFEFLSYAFRNIERYEYLKKFVVLRTQRLNQGAGELIFENYIKQPSLFIFGALEDAGANLSKIPIHLLNAKKIWDDFFFDLIYFVFSSFSNNEILKTISGDYYEALKKVRKHLDGFDIFADLVKKRSVIGIYFWNVESLDEQIEKSYKLQQIDEWLKALKEDRLLHRTYLFEEKTIQEFVKAYRRVKKGKAPNPIKIDYKEPWTLRDIYEHHPRGKDAEFWDSLIDALLECSNKLRNSQE